MISIPKDLEKKLKSSSAEIDPQFKRQLRQTIFKEETTMSVSNPFMRFIKYTRSAPALSVLAALIIVGSTSAFVASSQTNSTRDAEIEVPANLDDLISFADIRDIAERDAAGSSIVGIELEREDVGMVYKVKFSDDSVRFYDAKTGEPVSKRDRSTDDTPALNINNGNGNSISASEARAIALGQRSGTVTKIELESEHGVTVYSVRFADGGRVDVNASTGEVTRVRGVSNSGSGSRQESDDDRSGSSRSGSDDSGKFDDKGGDRDDDDSDDRHRDDSKSRDDRDDDNR